MSKRVQSRKWMAMERLEDRRHMSATTGAANKSSFSQEANVPDAAMLSLDYAAPVPSALATEPLPDTAADVKLLAKWMQQGLGAGKKIFDATSYVGEQDLRPFGFQPFYLADDGDLNRTVFPEQKLDFPDPSKLPAVERAYRKIARAAAGVDNDIYNHHYRYPYYNRVNQLLGLDLEAPEFGALDAMSDPVKRRTVINNMCRMIDAMKQEQAAAGVQSKGIGIFEWPPAFWSGAHTAAMPAALAQAQKDFKPLVSRVDAFFPEVYVHSDDVATWLTNFRGTIAACRAADPNKPIYPFVSPQYAHNATPAQMGQPVSEATWRFVMQTVLNETNGAVIWGGYNHRPGATTTTLPWGAPMALPTQPSQPKPPTNPPSGSPTPTTPATPTTPTSPTPTPTPTTPTPTGPVFIPIPTPVTPIVITIPIGIPRLPSAGATAALSAVISDDSNWVNEVLSGDDPAVELV